MTLSKEPAEQPIQSHVKHYHMESEAIMRILKEFHDILDDLSVMLAKDLNLAEQDIGKLYYRIDFVGAYISELMDQ